MNQLWKILRKYWWQILLLLGGMFVQVWASLQLPDMMAEIVNKGIVGGDQNFIWQQGWMMIVVTLIGGVGMIVSGFFAARVGAGFARDTREAIFSKVLCFSIAEVDKFSTASLITRTTNDVNQVQQTLVMLLRMGTRAPIMGVGAIIRALATAPNMAWIIALSVGVLAAVMVVLVVIVMPKFKIFQSLTDRLNKVTRENLTGIRVVRAFNNEKIEEQKFQRANQDLSKVYLFINRAMVVMFPVVSLILNFTTLLVIWVGAHSIDSGAIEIGNLMAFMQYAVQVMMSFMFLIMTFVIAPRAVVSLRRISEILSSNESIKQPDQPQKPDAKVRGVVKFDTVSFRYHGAEKPVLSDISFETKPGQTTAIIGSTGSGKSTIVNLIPRFYDVTSGSVTLDGVDVRNYTKEDLRSKIGLVPQKGVLFSGTVESNVALGMPEGATSAKANKALVEKAVRIAQATEFVEKMDGGFEARIAQGGDNVSGGQKQRLSIARAIAREPEIFIFDDSFSALDFKTDLKLRHALKEVTGNAAVLVVAQRIGTIKNAEQILVLNEGKIAGKGTHYELLKKCKVYREIAESQFSESEMKAEMKIAEKRTGKAEK